LLERVVKKPMTFGIRYLKRNPQEGLKMLVAVLMRELRSKQNYSYLELHTFYNEVIAVFFPYEVEQAANDPELISVNRGLECA
jgi:transposase